MPQSPPREEGRPWWRRPDGLPPGAGPDATPRQKRFWDVIAIVMIVSLGLFGLVIGSPYAVVFAVVAGLFLGFNIGRFRRV